MFACLMLPPTTARCTNKYNNVLVRVMYCTVELTAERSCASSQYRAQSLEHVLQTGDMQVEPERQRRLGRVSALRIVSQQYRRTRGVDAGAAAARRHALPTKGPLRRRAATYEKPDDINPMCYEYVCTACRKRNKLQAA